jgi:peptidoglycan/LPS O-acetylase OafA/YrhL
MPVREWGLPGLTKLLGDSPRYGVLVMAFFVGSFLVGVVMAKLIEFPMLRLRDRWFPAGGRSPTAKPILSN